ncbi:MAG TPA: glycosyl transferase family 1 [Polyangia bacterium]|nr:glycosyl transferase family 1 [Polyangia bacterium]
MGRRIAWLVPHPLKGSGGHRTIFQKVTTLAEAGHDCHVYLEPAMNGVAPSYATADEGRRLIESYFGAVPATFHLGFDAADAELIFATAWFTAIPLRRLQTKAVKAYFVQDFEAAFQPMGDQYLAAQNTLRYGFESITIGRWLARRLKDEYGTNAGFFDFCADLDVYRPIEGARRERSVCFLYQPDKPRRCSLLGAQALAIVARVLPDVKIRLYGHDDRAHVPFGFHNQGLLSIEDCNVLYNQSQVGLCISTTNPSRIPFEMMAAGLPVVDVFGENTRYDLPSGAIALAEPTAESVAHAIIGLLSDEPRLRRMSEAGKAFMRERALGVGLAQFRAYVDRLFDAGTSAASPPEPLYQTPHVRAPAAHAERYRVELERAEAEHAARVRAEEERAAREAAARAEAERRSRPISSVSKRIVNRLRHTLRVLTTGS